MAEQHLNKTYTYVEGGINTKINYNGAGTFVSPNYELVVPTILNATGYDYSFNELGTGTTTPGSTLTQSVVFTGWIKITSNLEEV